MRIDRFRVTNYVNILDSGWIKVRPVTAFVGQNEAGKSNLFEALYCINPLVSGTHYTIDEDWPVDCWSGKSNAVGTIVCQVEFELSEDERRDLYLGAGVLESSSDLEPVEEGVNSKKNITQLVPADIVLIATRKYGIDTDFIVQTSSSIKWNHEGIQTWARDKVPKFVYISEYDISGEQVELDQLKVRLDESGGNRSALSREDQTILIILDLAKIDLNDFVSKGSSPHGRTVRSFDRRSASSYLTERFKYPWTQKDVRFEIEVDGPTLNIFVEDAHIGMPVRLKRRSTGFRWYVSFAWNFTHASDGRCKNCVLLLEEPGVHLHFDGQKDLLETFERLSGANTIMYTTHLASMVDLSNPERTRIVESNNGHLSIVDGIVSTKGGSMAVIESSLGLTGSLRGMLGNR
jgi:predicted ATP-dependent endonuclease of OLD family